MPELPEVEVLARHLDRRLPGRRIRTVQVARPRSVRPHPPREFASRLAGGRFVSVGRRGKYLLFGLGFPRGSACLVGHLGMTGRIFCQRKGRELPRHAAVILHLDRGDCLFSDSRGFGRLTLESSPLERLGPEPLSDQFTIDYLRSRLALSGRPVKARLMDQDLVAGLGNIRAAEALYLAGVHPATPCRRLSRSSAARLHRAIRTALGTAIERGLSLPLDLDGPGRRGERLFYFGRRPGGGGGGERLWVYGREGEACLRCRSPIVRIVQAGRSSFLCPRCQGG